MTTQILPHDPAEEAGADPGAAASAVLNRSRVLTRPALRAAVDRLAPAMRQIAGYHLGWLDAEGRETESDTGKGIRPALAILSAGAAGSAAETGVPGAVAVELVHNFSLLHDDLMDGDRERHHRATAWTVFGSSTAILGGVALLTLAEEVLLELGTAQGSDAAHLLTTSTARLVTGQTDDLDFESRSDVGVAECLEMAGNKTAALMSASAAIGAVLAGVPDVTVAALGDFGEQLGLAFQLVDDLLGIWGEPERTGKPVLADLRVGKKSLPVVAALSSGGPDAGRLSDILGERGADDGVYAEAAALVEKLGGREWTCDEARRRLGTAYAHLDRATLPAGVRADLVAVADYVVSREL